MEKLEVSESVALTIFYNFIFASFEIRCAEGGDGDLFSFPVDASTSICSAEGGGGVCCILIAFASLDALDLFCFVKTIESDLFGGGGGFRVNFAGIFITICRAATYPILKPHFFA